MNVVLSAFFFFVAGACLVLAIMACFDKLKQEKIEESKAPPPVLEYRVWFKNATRRNLPAEWRGPDMVCTEKKVSGHMIISATSVVNAAKRFTKDWDCIIVDIKPFTGDGPILDVEIN